MTERFTRIGLLLMIIFSLAGGMVHAADDSAFQQQLWPKPMSNLYNNHLTAESSKWLSINIFDIMIDHSKAADAQQFTIISDDDPAFSADKQIHPLRTSSRTRTMRVALRKTLLTKATAIFLELPSAMKNGYTYRVQIGDIGATIPPLSPLPFDDHRQTNDNIRVNQIGYLTKQPKVAYLGQYMGSAGGLPFDVDHFQVLDPQGKVVFDGPVTRRDVNNNLVGQMLFDMNFTAFEPAQPGPYRLYLPGVGLSYPFAISSDALNPMFGNLMMGNYHQRCGQEITAPYSRFERIACHLDDAQIDQKSETLGFVKPKNPPLYPTRYGRHQEAIHGHHDAGDYGKYTTSGADYVFSILNAMEVFPDKFTSDNLGLPYSGNNIPDLLDEVKWELDWLENMQDPDDGGVFGVIKPNTGGYENQMPSAKAGRFFYPKDVIFTAEFAGALAHAASSPLMQRYFPNDCKRYLEKAVKAWQFLQENHRVVQYFHYGALFGDWDDRCWTAVELYRATGEDSYHQAFLSQFDPSKKNWGWQPLVGTVGNATFCYLFMHDRPRNEAMLERCRQAVRDACNKYIDDSEAFPYRLSMPRESIRHGSYGWLFPGDQFGYNLLMGYALNPDPKFLTCALNNLNYEMGANPSGYCLQTGLGWKRNIEVVDQESVNDDIIEPVQGIPLGIGSPGFYWLNKYGKTPNEGTYPADWPLMNRWYDGFNVGTEFTTGPLSRETVVAAYFAGAQTTKRPRPTVRITANQTNGAAPLDVQFSIQSDLHGGRISQIFWDFDDESFSTDFAPSHRFNTAGREYRVAVTIIDDQGVSAFDKMLVGARTSADAGPSAPFTSDAKTAALFHFDGDLSNAVRSRASAQSANDHMPTFADKPLAWMDRPSGACLVLNGDDLWQCELPAGPIATTGLTIQAMMYVRAFTGWGMKPGAILLTLTQDGRMILGIDQETWDRVMTPRVFGSAGMIVPSTVIAEKFPTDQWVHMTLRYDPPDHVKFYLDNQLIGEGRIKPMEGDSSSPLTLKFGQWRGMVDELCVSYSH